MNKKGVSEVVGVVLILLITITAVGVLTAFAIPFVKNNLKDSTNCLDVRGQVSIITEDSCYLPLEPGNLGIIPKTKVKVKLGNADIEGIYIVFNDPSSKSFDIKKNSAFQEINS